MSKKKKPRKKQAKTSSSATSKPSTNPLANTNETPDMESAEGSTNPSQVDQNPTSRISRYVSFGLLLGVIVIFGVVFYEVMAQFLVPLFLAALLVVVFRPLHRWIQEKCGGRQKLSALLTTASVLLVVLIPIGMLLVMAAAEGRQAYSQFSATKIAQNLKRVRTNLKLDMPSERELRLIDKELTELQGDLVLTPLEEDQHQIGLYEVQEAGKVLAQEQGLEWPEKNEEPPSLRPSAWYLFATSLTEARDLHGRIPWDTGKDPTENQQRNEILHDYQLKLNETADHFSDFRTQLLGGKTRAWAIEYVNPSDAETADYAMSAANFLRDKLFRIGGAGVTYVGGLLLGTAIMIIGLYFFLLDGPRMIETFKGLSPIDDEHEQELVTEFAIVSRAVVLATLLSALAQGLLAGIGFYFVGMDSIFLLTVLSAVLAMVPFVGAAAVWFPCCLYLYFFNNNLAAAIGLGVYGVAVISMADNIIKPYVLHGQSNIHPLFALLSVLGGVSTLGPIGILIGPMVVAFLQTLLRMLQREMTDLDRMAGQQTTKTETGPVT